jgi:hypothetical protein
MSFHDSFRIYEGGHLHFLGVDLDAAFEKELEKSSVIRIVRENNFSFKLTATERPGGEIVFIASLKNKGIHLGTTFVASMRELFPLHRINDNSCELLSYIIRCIAHQIEDELIKYERKTTLEERRRNAGIVKMTNAILSFSDSTVTLTDSYMGEPLMYVQTLNEFRASEGRPSIPKFEIDTHSTYPAIARLIGESKSRLNGPAKTQWTFKHF